MSNQNELTFIAVERAGGGGRSHVVYWDYLVDGRSLRNWLRVGDFIPPLGWLKLEAEKRFRQMLLLKQPSDTKSGRLPLLVCAECADYGCGVLTAVAEKAGDHVVWHSFGMENDYEDEVRLLGQHHQHRLVFDKTAYWRTISDLPIAAHLPER
ncbi:MAG: hypothetical protein U1F71_10680 [Verrucomicrobiaceae bacterium]